VVLAASVTSGVVGTGLILLGGLFLPGHPGDSRFMGPLVTGVTLATVFLALLPLAIVWMASPESTATINGKKVARLLGGQLRF
jgi:xanthine/uracil permease